MGYLKHLLACALDCDCKSTPCSTCAITQTCRTRSASKTKCGFAEFGTPSDPPKIYLIKTQSGGLSIAIGGGYTYTNAWSGSLTYASAACTTTDTRQLAVTVSGGCSNSHTFTGAAGQIDSLGNPGEYVWDLDCPSGTTSGQLFGCDGETVVSPSVATYAQAGCGDPEYGTGGGATVTLTLSSEYTTATLESNVDTALAAASWSGYGGCSDAIFTRSSDELTISKRAVDVKLSFSAVGSGMKLTFDVYDRTSATLVSSECVNLSAGATEHVHSLNPPSTAGEAHYVTNAAIVAGSC